jgi:hypothetical protein
MKKTVVALLMLFLVTMPFMVPSEAVSVSQEIAENSWNSLTPLPELMEGEAVAVYGQIHIIGGGSHYAYDPIKNEWIIKKPLPTERHFIGIAVCENKIYAIGGAYWADGAWVSSNVVEVYDPKIDTWETKAAMPTARSDLCANEVDGKIYLIGGQTGGPFSIVGINEVYDVASDTWATKKPLYNPVDAYASAVVDGKIYILGGFEGLHHGAPVDFNQIYDTKTDTWSKGTQMPNITRNAAAGATTGLLAPKRIYVVGGGPNDFPFNTTQVYDISTDSWTLGAEMPTARGWLTVAVVNDLIYAIGGTTNLWAPRLAANERYIPYGYGDINQTNSGETLGVTLISPENKTYQGSVVSLEFSSKKPLSWVGYRIDDGIIMEAEGNMTLRELSLGVHSLAVYTTDTDGNLQTTPKTYFIIEQAEAEILTLVLAATVVTITGTIIGLGLLIHHKKQKH